MFDAYTDMLGGGGGAQIDLLMVFQTINICCVFNIYSWVAGRMLRCSSAASQTLKATLIYTASLPGFSYRFGQRNVLLGHKINTCSVSMSRVCGQGSWYLGRWHDVQVPLQLVKGLDGEGGLQVVLRYEVAESGGHSGSRGSSIPSRGHGVWL